MVRAITAAESAVDVDALRIGDEAFFAFLKDYYTQNTGRIASEEDFFRVLDEYTDVDYSDVVKKYFRNR